MMMWSKVKLENCQKQRKFMLLWAHLVATSIRRTYGPSGYLLHTPMILRTQYVSELQVGTLAV